MWFKCVRQLKSGEMCQLEIENLVKFNCNRCGIYSNHCRTKQERTRLLGCVCPDKQSELTPRVVCNHIKFSRLLTRYANPCLKVLQAWEATMACLWI